MQTVLFHPLQETYFNVEGEAFRQMLLNRKSLRGRLLRPAKLAYAKGMGGNWFSDVFDTAWNGVTGLNDALADALSPTIDAIKQVGETMALVVRASIGDVSWSEVSGSLGKIFQDVGSVMVYLNPDEFRYKWLSQSPLTAHAFQELDKFTGGMITSERNVSTLVARAARGDAISKQELIMDALFAIQVAAVVTGGGVAVGAFVGNMVGKEVCSKQTEAKDACLAAFIIAGAAAGGWAEANMVSDVPLDSVTASPDAAKAFVPGQTVSTSYLPHLEQAASQYLKSKGIDEVTQQAVAACQSAHLIGGKECQILARIAADYLKSPTGKSWQDFLLGEIENLGVELLMAQWFPEHTEIHDKLVHKFEVRYEKLYYDQPIIVEGAKKFNPWTLLIIAAGAAAAMVGVGS